MLVMSAKCVSAICLVGNVEVDNMSVDNIKFGNMSVDNINFGNMSVDNIKFGNMSVDNIKFGNMSVDNIKFGNMEVDQMAWHRVAPVSAHKQGSHRRHSSRKWIRFQRTCNDPMLPPVISSQSDQIGPIFVIWAMVYFG
jgi:hypothetical protein